MAQAFQSQIVQQDRLLPGIHGLRGIAALAIALYHLNHIAGIAPPPFFEFIGRDFSFGVHLFFILSAFTLYHSTASRTSHAGWLPEYFIKRFCRIAPLFYSVMAFELARQIVSAGRIITDFSDILLNITFTFGFFPSAGIVWAGWSVGVEMIFYAMLPVLILTIRTHRSALMLLVASILISHYTRTVLHMQHLSMNPQPRYDWSHFAFAPNLCFFAMGIYAYHLGNACKGSVLASRSIALFAVIVIGGLLLFDAGRTFGEAGRLDVLIWGSGLTALCVWQSNSPSLFFANAVFEYLGERSFSIYLLHPIVIFLSKTRLAEIYAALLPHLGPGAFFVCAVFVLGLILLFAEPTYRLIEVPGIRLGRKLIARNRAR